MINFPTSLDDNTTLYVAVNNKRTALTSNIDASTLTIPVLSTTGFPSSGFITILTGTDITVAECIAYSSVGATQFNATLRGADGTTAVAHTSGNNVDLTIVAAHHNTLKDATIAIEGVIGVTGNENFVRVSSGSAVIPQNTVTNRVSANTVVASGSLTVSGSPVLIGSSIKAIIGGGQITVVTGSNNITVSYTDTDIPTAIVGARGITVISGSNTVIVSGTLPSKSTSTFLTSSILSAGGIGTFNQTFNNRALVRKLTVTPSDGGANSTVIEFYTSSSFSAGALEYRATSSGTYVDNETWFHEDSDVTSKYHLKITNNSLVNSQFTIDTIEEVFEP